MNETVPVMPSFSQAEHGFHHTIHSALETLAQLGVSSNRITVQMGGHGWAQHRIVNQTPAAGTALSSDQPIRLVVAGTGYFHQLPSGMWDRGSESEPGTAELVEIFDDPLQKAEHWVREGARLFDLHPSDYDACARWISLFGFTPEQWPRELWYRLALLLPNLHRLAGTEEGLRFALRWMLDLPLERLRCAPNFAFLPPAIRSKTGERYSQLGFNLIVGDRREDLAQWSLVLGPVALETYDLYRAEAEQAKLTAVLALVLPCYQSYQIVWSVLDRRKPVRLGSRDENGMLGVNSHLGRFAGTAGKVVANA